MNEIFIVSDVHFCHNKPFLYEPRGFTSIEEMNEAIVERWNEVVGVEDEVWNLGDFALVNASAAASYIQRLNGHIKWVAGNHDRPMKIVTITSSCPNVEFVGYAAVIKVRKFNFYLSHYPTLTGNMDDTGLRHRVISLHGHTHQKTNFLYPDNSFMYHAGVDSHNCYPVNIEEVITDIKNRYYEISQLGIERRPLYDFTKE